MHLLNSRLLSRRSVLKAGAVSVGLPLLEAMVPALARGEAQQASESPRRMLLSVRPLGTNAEYFFPEQAGPDYEAPRYLKILEAHRRHMTVFSGISHPGYPNSHHTEAGLLTGVAAEGMARSDDIRNTISLDQYVAERVGHQTRFSYVYMGSHNTGSLGGLSYTRDGVIVPGETNPQKIFRQFFINSSPEEVARQIRRLDDGQSILDEVRDQLGSLRRELGAGDRNRLDLFASSIRDAEKALKQNQAWAARPKPAVERTLDDYRSPNWSSIQQMYYDLAVLALQTDQTRTILIREPEGSAGNAPGATIDQHTASHHGQDPAKIEQFARFEEEETRNFNSLLDRLAAVEENSATLLDRTMVLWASNIGNPSAHASSNLPVLLAGGGFRHQGHVAFDRRQNAPLSNLYVRMLQQLGIETDTFGTSTSVLSELG